jgi:serine/threonine protein kinase
MLNFMPLCIQTQGHGLASDWWSLGCVVYEMMYGFPPFYGNGHHASTYRQVVQMLRLQAWTVLAMCVSWGLRSPLASPSVAAAQCRALLCYPLFCRQVIARTQGAPLSYPPAWSSLVVDLLEGLLQVSQPGGGGPHLGSSWCSCTSHGGTLPGKAPTCTAG